MAKNSGMVLLLNLIMIILFVSMFMTIFHFSGRPFFYEVISHLILILFVIVGVIGLIKNKMWGYSIMILFFTLELINLLMIIYFVLEIRDIFFPLIWAISGLIIGVYSPSIKKNHITSHEPIFEKKSDSNLEQEIKIETYDATKYIASKTGKKYHVPNCVLASKISKDNIINLETSAEAKKKGFRPCKCVK